MMTTEARLHPREPEAGAARTSFRDGFRTATAGKPRKVPDLDHVFTKRGRALVIAKARAACWKRGFDYAASGAEDAVQLFDWRREQRRKADALERGEDWPEWECTTCRRAGLPEAWRSGGDCWKCGQRSDAYTSRLRMVLAPCACGSARQHAQGGPVCTDAECPTVRGCA